MDVSKINWMYYALGVLGVITFVWVCLLLQRRWTLMSIVVSLPHLLTAGVNGAAPVRALVDPDYIGYGFGLFLAAERGWPVTLMAGSLVVTSAVSAWIAASNRPGPAMWILSATSAFSVVNLGWPILAGVTDGFANNRMQFGEYLTIPGTVAGPLQIVLLVGPFLLGAIWGARRALGHGGLTTKTA